MAPRPAFRYPSFFRLLRTSLVASLVALCIMPTAVPTASAQSTRQLATHDQTTADMQALVNDLGWQLANMYRGRTDEFNVGYAKMQSALEAWNQSGRTTADVAVMKGWLRGAIQACMPGAANDFPPTPVFHRQVVEAIPLTPALPSRSHEPVTASEPLPPPTIATAPVKPAVEPLAPSPAPLPLPEATDIAAATQESNPEPPPVIESAVDWPVADATEAASPQETETAKAREDVTPPAAAPVAVAPPSLDRHPSAAKLQWPDPFVDDPLEPATGQLASNAAQRRTARFRPVGESNAGVKIDLSELSARVRGHKQGLRFIEAELIASPTASAFRLAALARELESLLAQRAVLTLYYNNMSEIERMAMDDLPSAESPLQLLSTRLEQRREALAGSDSPATAAEQAVLQGVDRKLFQLQNSAPVE